MREEDNAVDRKKEEEMRRDRWFLKWSMAYVLWLVTLALMWEFILKPNLEKLIVIVGAIIMAELSTGKGRN